MKSALLFALILTIPSFFRLKLLMLFQKVMNGVKDIGSEFGYYLGWQTRYCKCVSPAIEKTATALEQAVNQIRQKYPVTPASFSIVLGLCLYLLF